MSLKCLAIPVFIFLLVCTFSCKRETNVSKANRVYEVSFDTLFSGARLSNIKKLADNKFTGQVIPSFEPVNPSPWFAFGVSSDKKRQIELVLDYGKYRHRYIPKLSTDRIHWKSIATSKVRIDSLQGTATLVLDVSPRRLYVAAQEIVSSQDTYRWMDSLLAKPLGIKKQVAGKTVLGNNNYLLSFENEAIQDAIVFVARQHPPEIPGGTIGFKKFYETIFSDLPLAQKFRKNFNIYAFPLLNPDGVDMGNWRHNARGTDLNRDWIDFTQPETQAVRTFLDASVTEDKRIRFAIDFHTSHSGPYMLLLDSINEGKTSGITPQWIQNIEATSDLKVNPRRKSQELPYCYNYFFNEWGSEAVTYEDGDEVDRQSIKRKAQVYAIALMKTLLDKKEDGSFKN